MKTDLLYTGVFLLVALLFITALMNFGAILWFILSNFVTILKVITFLVIGGFILGIVVKPFK